MAPRLPRITALIALLLLACTIGIAARAGMLPGPGVGVYVLRSGSMSPSMPTGTAIVTLPSAVYAAGDAITYREGTRLVTHRVVEVTADGRFITKGDANAAHDSWIVEAADVRGKVTATAPGLGYALLGLRHPVTLLLAACVLVWLMLRSRQHTPDPASPHRRP